MSHRPSSLETFGVGAELPREMAEELASGLEALWVAAHGRPSAGLLPDIEAEYKYFNPVAQGSRLRKAFTAVPRAQVSPAIPTSAAMPLGDGRLLVTPEGRILLELLSDALTEAGETVKLSEERARQLERELLDIYRRWGRHRQRQVIDLMTGVGKPLQLPAMGGALTLLVNRSDSPARAIKRFGPDRKAAQATVDGAFFTPADAFSQEIFPSKLNKEKEALISGWTLHEISRRIPGAIELTEDAVYVNPDRRSELIALIARELSQRKGVTREHVEHAFDALVSSFRKEGRELAGFKMLFESPAATERLRGELLDQLSDAMANS